MNFFIFFLGFTSYFRGLRGKKIMLFLVKYLLFLIYKIRNINFKYIIQLFDLKINIGCQVVCDDWNKSFFFRIHLLTKLITIQNWYHFSISKFWSIWPSVLYDHCCLGKVTNSQLVTCVDNWVEEQHSNTSLLHKSWYLTDWLARVD